MSNIEEEKNISPNDEVDRNTKEGRKGIATVLVLVNGGWHLKIGKRKRPLYARDDVRHTMNTQNT
jgi:hypothetical protein